MDEITRVTYHDPCRVALLPPFLNLLTNTTVAKTIYHHRIVDHVRHDRISRSSLLPQSVISLLCKSVCGAPKEVFTLITRYFICFSVPNNSTQRERVYPQRAQPVCRSHVQRTGVSRRAVLPGRTHRRTARGATRKGQRCRLYCEVSSRCFRNVDQ